MNKGGLFFSSYEDDCFLGGYGPGEDPLIMPPDQTSAMLVIESFSISPMIGAAV